MNIKMVFGAVTGLLAGTLAAAPDLTASLQYVCDPSFARWGTGNAAARTVLDLQVYHDRIYPGMGEWEHNSGPVYAMAINPFTGTCSNEYTMGTESCETIRVLADGNLHFPATDMKDNHATAGYWFRRNAAGEWYTRKSSFVNSTISTHIWDFTYFQGRYFAAGYGIASSTDGNTWTDVNPAWSNGQKSERFTGFITCGDELFARTKRDIPFNKSTGEMIVSGSYPAIYHHWNKTTKRFDTITNSYLNMNAGVKRSDFALGYSSTSLSTAAYANGSVWHATPFGDHCLYVLGSGQGISMWGPKMEMLTYPPVGVFPAALVNAWASNGELKGQRVTLETGAYPYDITVADGAAYVLTFKYKETPSSNKVEHAVWKSTDGFAFSKLFTFDFQQVMMSLEYHRGSFYFGVQHLGAQPYFGTLASGITDLAGSVYRVWCPQEPIPEPGFSGTDVPPPHVTASGDFAVSVANAVAGATYGVYKTETLSPPEWTLVRKVTAEADGPLPFTVETDAAPSCFIKFMVESLR